jgi:hypothetical protein
VSRLILPGERPAYPFLIESEAKAQALGSQAPEAPGTVGYSIALSFIHSPLLQGKAFVIGWRQGSAAREVAEGLRIASQKIDEYAAAIEALEVQTELAANESKPVQASPGTKGNGSGQLGADSGKVLDGIP